MKRSRLWFWLIFCFLFGSSVTLGRPSTLLVPISRGEPIFAQDFFSKTPIIGVLSGDCGVCKKQVRDIKAKCPDLLDSIHWLGLGPISQLRAELQHVFQYKYLHQIVLSDSKNLQQKYPVTPIFIIQKTKILKGYQPCSALKQQD